MSRELLQPVLYLLLYTSWYFLPLRLQVTGIYSIVIVFSWLRTYSSHFLTNPELFFVFENLNHRLQYPNKVWFNMFIYFLVGLIGLILFTFKRSNTNEKYSRYGFLDKIFAVQLYGYSGDYFKSMIFSQTWLMLS